MRNSISRGKEHNTQKESMILNTYKYEPYLESLSFLYHPREFSRGYA